MPILLQVHNFLENRECFSCLYPKCLTEPDKDIQEIVVEKTKKTTNKQTLKQLTITHKGTRKRKKTKIEGGNIIERK